MSNYQIHTQESAPADSTELLRNAEKKYGFVPNLLGVMAESPAMLNAYIAIGKIFDQSSFSNVERQVVILTASRINECHYCVSAHSFVAGLQNIPKDVIDSIRDDQPIADLRLEVLRRTVELAVKQSGWLSDSDKDAFFTAGYSQGQLLEVIVGISFKTLSNYTNKVADVPLDQAFSSARWVPQEKRLAS